MLMNNKQKTKENLFMEKKKTNDERLRELDKQHYMEQEEKLIKDQRQKIYRSLLDDQSKPYLRNSSMGAIGMNNNSLNVSSPNIQPIQNYGMQQGDFYQNQINQVNEINNYNSTPVPVKSHSPILNNRKREFDPNPCKK
jgi:hydroxylamine reductase (hybrid-cluster protein)